jgi:holo-[acyl-carrier protein] synthase
MIIGIGTDIVSIPRLVRSLERSGDSFARHVLAEAEWNDYVAVNDKARFLAKRFAVKEAFAKACGTGIRLPLSLSKIWVEHDDLGRPMLKVSPDVRAWLTDKAGPWAAHLSISDEKEVATAFVVLETC